MTQSCTKCEENKLLTQRRRDIYYEKEIAMCSELIKSSFGGKVEVRNKIGSSYIFVDKR